MWTARRSYVAPTDDDRGISPRWRQLLADPAAAPVGRAGRAVPRARVYSVGAMADGHGSGLRRRDGDGRRVRIVVYFTHSLRSCWNHGNAHFLRGVLRELQALGHDIVSFEPERSWSLDNLLRDGGDAGLEPFRRELSRLTPRTYAEGVDVAGLVDGADLVLVHEWNEPALVAAVGAAGARSRPPGFTHAVPRHSPSRRERARRDRSLRSAALRRRAGVRPHARRRVREAGLERPRPRLARGGRRRAVQAAHDPGRATGARLDRQLGRRRAHARAGDFPARPRARGRPAARRLRRALSGGGAGRCWNVTARATAAGSPNASAPEVFARHLATVHVPRRFYVTEQLPGIPTIRVFEALACGIPLVCAPWRDDRAPVHAGGRLPRGGGRCRDDDPPARARRRADPARPRWSRTVSPRSTRATPARIAPASSSPSPAVSAWMTRSPHENRVLRLLAAVVVLERGGHLLSRHAEASWRSTVTPSPSTSPTAYDRQSHRDIEPPDYARSVVYAATEDAVRHVIAEAATADVVVKASGVGVFDDLLVTELPRCGAPRRHHPVLGRRCAGDPGGDAAAAGPSDPPRPARARSRADLRRRSPRSSPPTRRSALGAAYRSTTRSTRRRISAPRRTRPSPPISPFSATACPTARPGSSSSSWSRPRPRRSGRSCWAAWAGTTSRCRPTCGNSATCRRATTMR